jgi:hypothetical protein
MKRLIAIFLLGVMAGAVAATLYATRDLDKLHDQVKTLEQANEELSTENAFLTAQSQQPDIKQPLKNIQVECITTPDDPSIEAVIKQKVIKRLSFFLGKPQDVLVNHPDLPANILDGQLVHVGKQKFRVTVTLVIMTHDELHLRVRGRLDT